MGTSFDSVVGFKGAVFDKGAAVLRSEDGSSAERVVFLKCGVEYARFCVLIRAYQGTLLHLVALENGVLDAYDLEQTLVQVRVEDLNEPFLVVDKDRVSNNEWLLSL